MKKYVIKDVIRTSYAKVAANGASKGCCSGGCGCSAQDAKASSMKLGYSEEDVNAVPIESNMGLGCGNPLAIASLKAGETVVDMGCGGGFDCFLARKQVGESGYVIGVDMTPDMVTLARKNVEKSGYSNIDIRLAEIEHLPIADATVDVIISNCVINLSTDKEQVMRETYRVLKKGGRLAISDVLAISEIPDEIRSDSQMLCGCVAGAEKVDTIRELLKNNGFSDISLTRKQNTDEIISSWTDKKRIEEYVASFYIEAKKA